MNNEYLIKFKSLLSLYQIFFLLFWVARLFGIPLHLYLSLTRPLLQTLRQNNKHVLYFCSLNLSDIKYTKKIYFWYKKQWKEVFFLKTAVFSNPSSIQVTTNGVLTLVNSWRVQSSSGLLYSSIECTRTWGKEYKDQWVIK